MEDVAKAEWKFVARFLLTRMTIFTEEGLIETGDELEEFGLILRILGADGIQECGGRDAISDAISDAILDHVE